MTKIGIIIVAGGSGTRMGAGVPKQFLPVCGKEILVHTLEKFLSALGSIGAANINAGAGAAIGKQAGKAGEQAENSAKNEAGIGTNMRKALPTNIATNINGSATISAEIVIVLPAGHIPVWNEIAAKHSFTDTHRVCAGGQNRFMSVYNGLEALGECDIIAIHDGVRPLLSQELICRCLTLAGAKGTAIPVVEPVDSFRILTCGPTPNTPDPAPAQPAAETEASITGTESGNPQTGIAAEGPPVNSMEQINSPIHDSTRTCSPVDSEKNCRITEIAAEPVGATGSCLRQIDRSLLRAVQTPQIFRADIIRNAYKKALDDAISPPAYPLIRFTDDASVAEYSGVRLSFCEGEQRNIKITHPEDLLFAKTLLLQNLHNR